MASKKKTIGFNSMKPYSFIAKCFERCFLLIPYLLTKVISIL